jgi:hypothetical protein
VLSVADRKRKTLIRSSVFGRYLPSGHLLYVNQGTLYTQVCDPEALKLHGVARHYP